MKVEQFRDPSAQNTSENPSLKHLLNPGPRARHYLIKKKINTEAQVFSRSLKLELNMLLY